MYEPFFEFRERPFSAVPRADEYFPSEAIEAARTTLVRCIRRAEGPGLVIGPPGTGKTLLCHVLAGELADQLRVVLLTSGRLGSRRALLQAILYELGQPYRGLDEGEARLALADYITLSDECPNGVLLLVDEAHTLPLRLLDEVRMTTNLAHGGKPWVRVVLAGGCVLEERFAGPKLDSFNQRIAARCYLESMSAAETPEYVWAQIERAGGRGESLFPQSTCKAVYRATDGVPRLINQVCDHALLLACAAGHAQITAEHIEEAWADLQQLPTPWNADSARSSDSGDIIEFGRLDDETETSEAEAQEAPDTIPALRISAEPDDESKTGPNIEGQVDQIEQMLDQVDFEDGEFAPAGSIGPEVELRFDAPHDPFGEEFAEEEVVDDWPGTVGRAHFPDPVTPGASPAHPAAPAARPASDSGTATADDQAAIADEQATTELHQAPGAPDAEGKRGLADESVGALAEDVASPVPDAGERREASSEEAGCETDRDLPVCEERATPSPHGESDSERKQAALPRRVVAAPRQKYSRLFASLRRA